MFECSLLGFLLLLISFKNILTKVSFQYVQKLLHFVYLLILTVHFLYVGIQGLYVQDYGKLWQARFESQEASCFRTWTHVEWIFMHQVLVLFTFESLSFGL